MTLVLFSYIAGSGECEEYYDDYWIFGEGAPLGPKQNNTQDNDDEEEEEGSADYEDEGAGNRN